MNLKNTLKPLRILRIMRFEGFQIYAMCWRGLRIDQGTAWTLATYISQFSAFSRVLFFSKVIVRILKILKDGVEVGEDGRILEEGRLSF